MPIRYIKIPEPITLRDPASGAVATMPGANGEQAPVVWDFGTILAKIMSNPKWSDSLAQMRAQAAIMEAFEAAKAAESHVLELAEEDWTKLREAVETPRTLIPETGQVVPGFGLIPSMGRQLLPLVLPIADATTQRPKE